MTSKIELNGDGVPKVYLKPGPNPIEALALSQLLEAANKGTAVTLASDGDKGVVLSVKTSRMVADEVSKESVGTMLGSMVIQSVDLGA